MWTVERVSRTTPKQRRATTEVGDWQGTAVWTKRYAAAILNELIVAVKAANKSGILKQSEFVRTINRLDDNERTEWINIVDTALERHRTASELRDFLDRVRNRAAFHFDRGRLWEGYVAHFQDGEKNEFNDRAYMSVGNTASATRFYFADAAAQMALERYDSGGELFPMVNTVLRSVNVGLSAVIDTHIGLRIYDAQKQNEGEM